MKTFYQATRLSKALTTDQGLTSWLKALTSWSKALSTWSKPFDDLIKGFDQVARLSKALTSWSIGGSIRAATRSSARRLRHPMALLRRSWSLLRRRRNLFAAEFVPSRRRIRRLGPKSIPRKRSSLRRRRSSLRRRRSSLRRRRSSLRRRRSSLRQRRSSPPGPRRNGNSCRRAPVRPPSDRPVLTRTETP